MKIYYIYHSCFVVETKDNFLIFDYYKSKQFKEGSDFDFNNLLNDILASSKNIYVFASHGHYDHFNKRVLDWSKQNQNIHYILSEDIKMHNSIDNTYMMKKNEELKLNDMTINTFGSTDAGISFLINIENTNIFHSGDLNWWKWNDDTPAEEKAMETAFKDIVSDIVNCHTHIDVAFFPVDSRLEENYLCGGDYFIQKLSPDMFIPMHFGDDCKITDDFLQYINESGLYQNTKVFKINNFNMILL